MSTNPEPKQKKTFPVKVISAEEYRRLARQDLLDFMELEQRGKLIPFYQGHVIRVIGR